MFPTLLNFLRGIEIFMSDGAHASGGPVWWCARRRPTAGEGLADRHRVGFPRQARRGEEHSSSRKDVFSGTAAPQMNVGGERLHERSLATSGLISGIGMESRYDLREMDE